MTIEQIIVILLNFRSSVAFGETSIQEPAEKRGADTALTMLIEDFRALISQVEQ